MSSSRIYYDAVQSILTRRIAEGRLPTTREIQEEVFGDAFVSDSSRQRDLIYEAIAKGRYNALDKYNLYIGSPEHMKDMIDIEFYKAEEMERQLNHPDYGEFFVELKMGRFGDKTEVIETYLDAYVLVAAIWEKKLHEFSQKGDNLIIASYGRRSVWRIPTWWKWAIRETNLYLRSITILAKQFKRGVSTGLLTSSGIPLSKAIEYSTSIQGILENGATWQCTCGMFNSGSSNYCSNCGKPRPALPSPT